MPTATFAIFLVRSPASRSTCVRTLIRVRAVRQMRRQDHQRPGTYQVTLCTENLRLLFVEAGDLRPVLSVLRVAVENDACDLALDGRGERLDGAMGHGSPLGVAAGEDDAVGALGGHLIEDVGHGFLGLRVGAAGERVGRERGGVVDAFCSDVGVTEGSFDAVGGLGAADSALDASVWDTWSYGGKTHHVAYLGGTTSKCEHDCSAATLGELIGPESSRTLFNRGGSSQSREGQREQGGGMHVE
jgi:hypothetical protein